MVSNTKRSICMKRNADDAILDRREEADAHSTDIDFVWETHVPRQWKAIHDRAKVLNRWVTQVLGVGGLSLGDHQ